MWTPICRGVACWTRRKHGDTRFVDVLIVGPEESMGTPDMLRVLMVGPEWGHQICR